MQSSRSRLPFVLLIVLGFTLLATHLLFVGKRGLAQAAEPNLAPQRGSDDARLEKAYRFDRDGWVYVHLEGAPHDVGFQHGYLLAPEIADAFASVSLNMTHSTGRDWDFFRATARDVLWPGIDPEYREELAAIAEGAQIFRGIKG